MVLGGLQQAQLSRQAINLGHGLHVAPLVFRYVRGAVALLVLLPTGTYIYRYVMVAVLTGVSSLYTPTGQQKDQQKQPQQQPQQQLQPQQQPQQQLQPQQQPQLQERVLPLCMPRQVQIMTATKDVAWDESAPAVEIGGGSKQQVYDAVVAHLRDHSLPPPQELFLYFDDDEDAGVEWSGGSYMCWGNVVNQLLAAPHLRILAITGALHAFDKTYNCISRSVASTALQTLLVLVGLQRSCCIQSSSCKRSEPTGPAACCCWP